MKIFLRSNQFCLAVIARLLTYFRVVFSFKENKLFKNNMKNILNLGDKSIFSKMFIRQVYHSQILITLETLYEIIFPQTIKWEGLHELGVIMNQLDVESNGKIMITGHLGAWELIGYLASSKAKKSFYALAKPAKISIFTKVLNKIRERMGIKVIWTGTGSTQAHMINVMNEGSWLGFVMDQKPRRRKGPLVNFWGQKTEFVSGPAQMAIKFNIAVLAVFCVRTGPFRYRVIPELILSSNHNESDHDYVTQLMASKIEQVSRIYPEQWCWSYKRWRFDDKMV